MSGFGGGRNRVKAQGEGTFSYHGLGPDRWDTLHGTLARIYTGEIEPYYIQRHGFYEGHTAWRADPLGIAMVFGLRSIEELERAFPKKLDRIVREHHVALPRQ